MSIFRVSFALSPSHILSVTLEDSQADALSLAGGKSPFFGLPCHFPLQLHSARVRVISGENIGIVNMKMRTDHPVAVRPVRSGDLLLDGMAIDGIGGSPSLSKV